MAFGLVKSPCNSYLVGYDLYLLWAWCLAIIYEIGQVMNDTVKLVLSVRSGDDENAHA